MKIREYNEKDENEVVSLWKACGLVAPQNDPFKDIQRKLQADRDLFLVGYNENGIMATVMGGYEGHRGWINYLAVKPFAQRKGYGQLIMQAIQISLCRVLNNGAKIHENSQATTKIGLNTPDLQKKY